VKALVTGGAGFIGSHLTTRLLADGFSVRVLDNFATGRRENLAPVIDAIELIEGDIQSYERVHTAVRGCEYVFHQAALPSVPRSVQDPLTSNATNVIGTLNVLLASRDSDVRRVIFASSSSAYGPGPELPKRESQSAQPISPYAVAKLAGEGYCRSFSEVYGLDTVALRYFNVFGPQQDPFSEYAAVIPNFITAALAARRPVVFGDGEQTRDFTFIENVVEANIQAMAAPEVTGEVLNVACGQRVSVNTLLGEISSVLDVEIRPSYIPARPGDIRDSLADITKARRLIGYAPRVSFTEGIARTIAWFQESDSNWAEAVPPTVGAAMNPPLAS
jgi:nucleoside-diphosphate-sugar epimerase